MLSKRTFLALCGAASLAACAPAAPTVSVGGPFTLIDQSGRTVDESILKGKWSAVYFGFTYCPDVCPTTLTTLAQAADRMGAKAKDFQVILVSVDPARDTPALLKTYLDNPAFPKRAIGLTGSAAQVDAAAKAYKIYYKKVGEGDAYTVDHSAMTFLMNPKGQFARIVANGTPPDEIARIVADAMRGA
jgi:protein SCO1/2